MVTPFGLLVVSLLARRPPSVGRVWWWIATLSVLAEISLLTAAWPVSVRSSLERNVALNKPCNQSSVWHTGVGLCDKAVNGRFEDYDQFSQSSDCIHTSGYDLTPWWTVNLGPNFYIHKLVIQGRTDFYRRMANMTVLFDGIVHEKYSFSFRRMETYFDSTEVQKVQNVTLTKNGSNPDLVMLNICELAVYGCNSDRWGLQCEGYCSSRCRSGDVQCDRLNGFCIECKTNTWGRERCEYQCHEGCKPLDVTCDKETGVCIECKTNTWGRERCENQCPEGCKPGNVTCDRETGICRECKTNTWGRERCENQCPEGCKPGNVTCDRETGVCIECKTNTWGRERCENQCPEGCKPGNVTCDRETGICRECPDGKWGNNCSDVCGEGCDETNCNRNGTFCDPGKWGDDCLNDCAEGCKDGVCNKANGHCNCTTTKLEPPLCGGCNPGKWGKNCTEDCGVGCEGETCKRADGSCECQPGWGGTKCDGRPCKCGEECTTSRKYIFADIPRKVNVAIGKPSKASTIKKIDNDDSCLANDGYLSTSELTTCMSTAEGDPNPFWEVDLGGNYEIAGINIDFDDDKMNLKSGISILLDGKEIFVTNDETTDPAYIPNNRRRNWTGQVLKLQRKGPRKDPLMICEVEVFNCLPGFFGYECEGICEKPVCDNARFCSRIDGSCQETVEVKETSDCSPLILVAGYVVGFLIISLFIFAAKVIPYKKKSKPKAVKKEAEGDKEEEKTEGEGSGSGGDKVEELEAEGDKVEQEAEAEGEVQNEANSEIEERETQV
ncbi:multiple epidermal growth factor-like domains protein 6 isoform X2 [Pomacea canaliculata]|uniref:multiple epidermal growth factor-like domains protein 6 isoform X2 n=1 Tax=Pomacea canaliculata TaxID=400727 RepID=UPI000D72A3D4|nr:multiple epidermal growth factor-like domains protein 6 isoform X2 [Pomacea canaliculata]